MKKKSNLIEILIYLILLISLFAYEANVYKYYSYIQIILFGIILFTFLACMKNKIYNQMFCKHLKSNKIILLLCFLMSFNTLLCCLIYRISITTFFIVLLYTVNIMFFYFLIPTYFHENKDFTEKFTNSIIIIISILSLFGIILYFHNGLLGYYLEGGRSGSIYFDSNYFALVACVPLILLLRKKYKLIIKLFIALIAIGAMLCSGSRGTMLGVGIGIIYLIFVKFPSKNKFKKLLVIIISIIAMYSFFLYLERISFLRIDQGSHGRLEMFSYAINQMKKSPIIGFGFGSISESLMEGGFVNTNTHNSLIDFAFRYGYPCLAIYLLLILKIIFKSFKDKKYLDIDILIIVFLVNMNTILYSFGGLGIVSIILSICLGILGCYGGVKNEEN